MSSTIQDPGDSRFGMQVKALEAERQVFRAMRRAGIEEQRRQRLALCGVPEERVERMLAILDRVASRPAPPGA
ncbi:unannotated protein [freshwater metagenome]|uniref:Unannotated protein n=1 Tax=freshwater metagenome TaxID=449393 RepID=A0A6J7FPM6_9ZZZZ|nr:hypothetical protein [Actinomycetota bacterium]